MLNKYNKILLLSSLILLFISSLFFIYTKESLSRKLQNISIPLDVNSIEKVSTNNSIKDENISTYSYLFDSYNYKNNKFFASKKFRTYNEAFSYLNSLPSFFSNFDYLIQKNGLIYSLILKK